MDTSTQPSAAEFQASVPSAADVQARLKPLSFARLKRLSVASGVSFTTLWTIQTGERANPGLETVRKFLHLIDSIGPDDETEAPPASAAATLN